MGELNTSAKIVAVHLSANTAGNINSVRTAVGLPSATIIELNFNAKNAVVVKSVNMGDDVHSALTAKDHLFANMENNDQIARTAAGHPSANTVKFSLPAWSAEGVVRVKVILSQNVDTSEIRNTICIVLCASGICFPTIRAQR